MLLYHGKKALKLLFASLCIASSVSVASADSCGNRVFNIKVADSVTTGEILNQLSDVCNFSIIRKDEYAKSVLDDNVSGISIKDLTLNEIFDVLIEQNNLSYDFSKNVLQISSTITKTFKVNYITSVREGRAITKASVDSAPVDIEDLSGSETSTDIETQDNVIKSKEKFDFWENLQAELKSILNNGSEKLLAPDPIINSNAGLVTVTGTNSQLKRIESYLANLEKSLKKQVMIDVSIINIQLHNEFKRGVDWSKFSLGFNSYVDGSSRPSSFLFGRRSSNSSPYLGNPSRYSQQYVDPSGQIQDIERYNDALVPSMKGITGGFILGGGISLNLDGMLNFLETKGRAKVVSSPKVMTMNNQQALISVGDNVNYQVIDTQSDFDSDTRSSEVTQYSIFIGILLNILPQISDDNKIMLRINPSLSTFKWNEDNQRLDYARNIAPDTLQKKLSTVVEVNDGDTIVLGGLISETNGKDINKVPLLGDLPLFGYLFKSVADTVTTNELVFVITPKIVNSGSAKPIKESLKDLGFFGIMYE